MAEAIDRLADGFTWNLRVLLETRHLYQHVVVDAVKILGAEANIHTRLFSSTAEWLPCISSRAPPQTTPRSPLEFDVPSVRTYCRNCKSHETHNPADAGQQILWAPAGQTQLLPFWYLVFECPRCLGTETAFLVHRDGLRFTLAGRWPMSVPDVHDAFPAPHVELARKAVIARQTNYILAAHVYLRCLIEQHCRRVTGKAEGKDIEGIIDAYMEALDTITKEHAPSLRQVYAGLSAAIHAAREKPEEFDDLLEDTQHHFEAVALQERQRETERKRAARAKPPDDTKPTPKSS